MTQLMQSQRALRFRFAATCLVLFWILGCQHAEKTMRIVRAFFRAFECRT